jgi:hypothetical protein
MVICNIKKLSDVEIKDQYHVKISNRFATLKKTEFQCGYQKELESVGENIKLQSIRIYVITS